MPLPDSETVKFPPAISTGAEMTCSPSATVIWAALPLMSKVGVPDVPAASV